jgi:RNA polymerase sigma-70 factor (ECF subfamily)
VSESLEVTNDVILRAQQGDTAKIGVLFQRYHQSVFRYLYYRVNDLHTAEDLTSEVFLRMLRALPDYRLQGVSFQAWLLQIARNLSVDHFRKSASHPNVEIQENLVASGPDPAATAESSLTSESLRLALGQLPSEQREVIIFRFILGMPITEVASVLKRSEDSVKGLQRRGLIALREHLDVLEISYV